MAVKRNKFRKFRANPIARLKPRGSEAPAPQRSADLSEELLDQAALPEAGATRVMLVIALASLAYISFIAWCVAQMPAE
jgi:predicted DNA-binding transcriptional regulator YafY